MFSFAPMGNFHVSHRSEKFFWTKIQDHFKLCPALLCREDAACILITQQQQKDKSKHHVHWFDLKQLYKKNNL
ncbi:hypothetical protein T01_8350 [Trichinella spiralis]|uniref:Uncharacterized protein n=1 Tax=Trichinella spiralis TaxID=6334 RepID=A0A0V1BGP4_TRISP|nr:hypothetical protein T01_8350 [Trichinella spiralis]